MDPDMINCVILCIHLDAKKVHSYSHAIYRRTSIRARFGSKKTKLRYQSKADNAKLGSKLEKFGPVRALPKSASFSRASLRFSLISCRLSIRSETNELHNWKIFFLPQASNVSFAKKDLFTRENLASS